MPLDQKRFDRAVARFDEMNAQDPVSEPDGGGEAPRALLYGRRMSEVLGELEPDASEELVLAARAQHLCRFRIPRDRYPEGAQGYKRWRAELMKVHADLAGEVLREAGYDEQTVGRTRDLIRKKRMKSDPEAQTLEDVVCLVFLAHYLGPFADEHDDDKLIDILRKTWVKMSKRGHTAALALELPPRSRALVERALPD